MNNIENETHYRSPRWDETESVPFETLLGKTFVSIKNPSESENPEFNEDSLRFKTDKNEIYIMYHDQDCCESVFIESIVGDLSDLLSGEILLAEEIEDCGYGDNSFTWTFYKLATIKGYVDIRWYGESNGYYSETVSLVKVKEDYLHLYEF